MKFSALLLFIALYCCPAAVSQSINSRNLWSAKELENANTAKHTSYLNEEEKKIIFYMNLARTDGEKFFNTFFQDFVNVYNEDMRQYSNYEELRVNRKDKYYRGLQQDLKGVKGLPLFSPDETLTWIAQQHTKDMNRNNIAEHNSSDGRTPHARISKYYPGRAMAETLAFGFSKGLANVSMLLLDKGVPDLGHRRTILGTSYKLSLVGVNISKHPGYKYCAAVDFISAPAESK